VLAASPTTWHHSGILVFQYQADSGTCALRYSPPPCP
jgi:hypothetical protein